MGNNPKDRDRKQGSPNGVAESWDEFQARKRRHDLQAANDPRRGSKRRNTVRASRFERELAAVCADLGIPLDEEPREIAHAYGHALEAARAEEKWAAQSGGGKQLDFKGLSLLRGAEQARGPLQVLDVLVPSLRTVGSRIVVLEDRVSRTDRFEKWFGSTHELVQTKVIRDGIELLRAKKADYLFLDFDVHDPGDRTLRDWLNVHPSRKELDGLDLATYVQRMAEKDRPGTVIVHSRNPVGAKLMSDFLEKIEMKPVNWVFDYDWKGLP